MKPKYEYKNKYNTRVEKELQRLQKYHKIYNFVNVDYNSNLKLVCTFPKSIN